MSSNITFTVNAQDFVINTPEFGYSANINLAMIHQAQLPRGYSIWDNGVTNDYRTCKADFLLNASNTDILLDMISAISKGRGQTISMNLGANSGFYPFGPDLGDSGAFNIRILNPTPQPVMEEPWMWFRTTLSFVMVSKPAYVLPSEVDEGDITIGSISGLRYPPGMPDSTTNYGFSTQLTYDGTPYTIDKTINSDENVTSLQMVCNQSKAAALVNHMTQSVRDANLTIQDNTNGYFFGREAGEDNTYTCQWLDSQISIRHTRFDEFAFGLTFYRVSTA